MRLNKITTAITLLLTINLIGCNSESNTTTPQVKTPSVTPQPDVTPAQPVKPHIKPDVITPTQPVKPHIKPDVITPTQPDTAMDCFNGELYTIGATSDVYMLTDKEYVDGGYKIRNVTTVSQGNYNNQSFLKLHSDYHTYGAHASITQRDNYVRLINKGAIASFYTVSKDEVSSTSAPAPMLDFNMEKGQTKQSNSVTLKKINIKDPKTQRPAVITYKITRTDKRTFIGHAVIMVNGVNYQTCHFKTAVTAITSSHYDNKPFKVVSHITNEEFVSVDSGLPIKSIVTNNDVPNSHPNIEIITKASINGASVM